MFDNINASDINWADNQQKKAQTVKLLCYFGSAELEKMVGDYKEY